MHLARYHRLRSRYYRLEGERCSSCRKAQFPPRGRCRACGSASLDPWRPSGLGTIYSHAAVAQAPQGFPDPYLVALIQLEEGLLLTAQLTDIEPQNVRIGMRVEMVTRRIQEQGPEGYLVYGYKFRPMLAKEVS